MPAKAATWWNPPPPPLDIWADLRAQAPDTADFEARHCRGYVRLPYDIDEDLGWVAGAIVDAWVCCDPGCGGVELGEAPLDINHHCCKPPRYSGTRAAERRHTAGRGRYHGPYTPYWQPER